MFYILTSETQKATTERKSQLRFLPDYPQRNQQGLGSFCATFYQALDGNPNPNGFSNHRLGTFPELGASDSEMRVLELLRLVVAGRKVR